MCSMLQWLLPAINYMNFFWIELILSEYFLEFPMHKNRTINKWAQNEVNAIEFESEND